MSPWKLLSVADFLERYREQSDLAVTPARTTVLPSSLIWQKQTVQTFFTAYPWSPSVAEPNLDEPFGLQLSVQSYFQYFAWNAPTKNFSSQASEEKIAATEEDHSINLQNFSDLF